MKKFVSWLLPAGFLLLTPVMAHAKGIADDLHGLQGMLRQLYDQMLPLCSGMIGVSRAIGGFGALFFIGARIWKHQAAAEPIDVYPLLRPFAIGFCIAFFPLVLRLMNGVLEPTVSATYGMVVNSNAAMERLLAANDESTEMALPNEAGPEPDKWYEYSHPDAVADASGGNPISDAFSGWSIKNWARKFIYECLNVLFQAAALSLDAIRTFKLVVLSILGPLCFGLSIFDGFQHTLKQWIARYVNVFMWLPIANIFGAIIAKIQVNMLTAIQSGNLGGNEFGNTSTAYLIFLLIGILGYFTVPGIANYIMNVGGHALFNKTSAMASMAMSYVTGSIMQNLFTGNTTQQTNIQQNNQGQTTNTYQTDKLKGSSSKSS